MGKDIQHDKNISLENIKHLFTYDIEDGKYFREVKQMGFIHYEYCKQEEVEAKWDIRCGDKQILFCTQILF